jgi:cytochrome c oxidase cbb3-type subunit 3
MMRGKAIATTIGKPTFVESNMHVRNLWAIVAPVFLATVYLVTNPAAPRAQETTENPFTTRLDVQMGGRLFRQQCGRCHGRDAKGGESGPDLASGLRSASTDAGLFRVVREGIPNTQMIGISRNATDQSVWMVVSYLKSLNDTAEVDLPGNAAAGRQLFNGKGNCASCHMVSGQGGRRGPELTQVGNRRDPDELVSDLTTPGEDVAPRWWTMRVTREDGSRVEGLRMNEDTFTLRLMDEDENLWSFSKGRVRSYERIETSIMPSVVGTLTTSEVDDLVAYLFSLRRAEN